ncbi:RNA helicase [Anaerococcus urinomassiliensis]|uniref:RNA helicase n=1 Tax=Anaerococcus urinomassiliensis TaxID=1745712 RepID=UPI000939F99C|nr:RNA helicase [Anaerococcus urinomassiliensis]
MKKLEIILDLGDGPLVSKYYDEKSDRLLTGIDVVDNDEYIQKLNNEIQDLYSSYYKIDYNDEPVYFDKDQEKKDKYKMLDLLKKLIKRLNELNDGSFEIYDRETERVKNL